MKKNSALTALVAILLMVGCSQPVEKPAKPQADSNVPGDSTLYGLACDGCTDTILVVLRDITQDPDTLNILSASRQHRIFGMPRIGDQLAIVLNDSNPKVADLVINLEQLQTSWCYMVQPKLRERADVSKAMQQEFLENIPDSVFQKLLAPREYGFTLKDNHDARPVGAVYAGNTTDEQSPVEYPKLKRYRQWAIYNGRLVLNETALDSLGQQQLLSSDTADFVMMRRDSLVLRFAEGEQGYYNASLREASEK